MDKQMIEEMAEIALKNTLSYTCAKQIAMNFYNAGYRKIPEGAVVLTREEAEKVYNIVKEHEKVWEDVKELKADFTKEMYALKKDLEKDFEEHEQAVRKETAEKFARDSKQRLSDKLHRGKALHTTVFGKEYVRRIFKEVVDEIAKEIKEGKDGT